MIPALAGTALAVRRPRSPVTRITVIVPAHDEAHRLRRCLASLNRAAARVEVFVDVVVVLDACTDGSRDQVPDTVRVVEIDAHNVGEARAAGLRDAPRGPTSWYATTDADCEVPPTWLTEQVASSHDHDVFVGTVAVEDWSPRSTLVQGAYARVYAPVRGHPHVHGANLGLSAAAYWAVGGFAPLHSSEDVDLVDRCLAAGFGLDRSDRAPVTTSARRSARTPDGFSAYLDALEQELPA